MPDQAALLIPSVRVPFQDRHLGRSAINGMRSSHIVTHECIAISLCYTIDPGPGLRTPPLEAVIGMAETMRRHAQHRIEVAIRRGDDHRPRTHFVEDTALDHGQAIGIDMLDRFDQNGGVEAGQRNRRACDRPMNQLDFFTYSGGRFPQLRPQLRQRLRGQINADDAPDGRFLRQSDTAPVG